MKGFRRVSFSHNAADVSSDVQVISCEQVHDDDCFKPDTVDALSSAFFAINQIVQVFTHCAQLLSSASITISCCKENILSTLYISDDFSTKVLSSTSDLLYQCADVISQLSPLSADVSAALSAASIALKHDPDASTAMIHCSNALASCSNAFLNTFSVSGSGAEEFFEPQSDYPMEPSNDKFFDTILSLPGNEFWSYFPGGKDKLSDFRNYITYIIIPNNISKIKKQAFSGCVALKNVSIPNTVTKICKMAFYTHTVCVPYYKAAPYNISHT